MRKTITVLLIVSSLLAMSFQTAQPVAKPLTVQGDAQTFQVLINTLDKSTEAHNQVEAVKKWLLDQLIPQLQAQQPKPIMDTALAKIPVKKK